MASETPLILDGGLGSLLFSRGAFVKGDPLWSARCLTSAESDGRRQLRQAHLDYLAAGADVIKTNSYQMSSDHLRKCLPGLTQEESLEMMRDSVRIARDACRDYWQSIGGESSGKIEPKVAGSIGPYGACQADLSEYTGAYVDCMSEEDFIEWHRPRLMALLEAGVDYLAFETFPALLEANAILRLLQQEAPHMPAWISFSCKDEKHVCHGETLASAFEQIWTNKTEGLKAVGINCTPGRLIKPLLRSLGGVSNIPVILYPNREECLGEEDELILVYPKPDDKQNWKEDDLGKLAKEWLVIHPHIFAIGGCCFYHPSDIHNLSRAFGN
ncbi:homocysteine S-methyltransferase YbgG-like [Daphnia carinata]|uniref:homocysteine S-methyltransferase YbgG-like n=1 Tax=Daphnia carinata TaxID=120202 RepID=UPI00257B59EC|nr:homocysteine S-methyltransferase YbgG-like [Daphnia carinata]